MGGRVAVMNDGCLEWIGNQRTFWSTGDDLKQLPSNGAVAVASCLDDIARPPAQDGKPIRCSYPREGARGWMDRPGLIVEAPHPDAAYRFMDDVCQADVGVEMAKASSMRRPPSRPSGRWTHRGVSFWAPTSFEELLNGPGETEQDGHEQLKQVGL